MVRRVAVLWWCRYCTYKPFTLWHDVDVARANFVCFKTVGAIYAFFLSMALHPEVAKTAQRELDDLIGGARLPCFADRESLPYINALTLEVLRWHVVTPIGMFYSQYFFNMTSYI